MSSTYCVFVFPCVSDFVSSHVAVSIRRRPNLCRPEEDLDCSVDEHGQSTSALLCRGTVVGKLSS